MHIIWRRVFCQSWNGRVPGLGLWLGTVFVGGMEWSGTE